MDVLALQETKCKDEQFPTERFTELGYEVAHHGLSQWNGVALLSRVGLTNITAGFPGQPTWGDPAVVEARALGAHCGGVQVWSLYIPNGRGITDPHLAYKLQWLEQLRTAGSQWLQQDPSAKIALVGDWNVAPTDGDVWDMAAFEGLTHVTEPERSAFTAMVEAGFTDVVRPLLPGPGVYTYWDYQQLRFPKKQGMRIDFILASAGLASKVTAAQIDRDERKGKGASDHAPVIIEFEE